MAGRRDCARTPVAAGVAWAPVRCRVSRWGRRRRAGLAAAALAVALAWPAPVASAGQDPSPAVTAAPGPVVVVGVGGVTWQDLSETSTPAMTSLVSGAAIAHLSVRSVYPVTCPVDAWLTLGAGRRAAAPRDEPALDPAAGGSCPEVPPVHDGHVVGWSGLVSANEETGYAPTLGTLASTAAEAGACVLGSGPGGELAVADEQGAVARSVADPSVLLAADLASCDLTVVDLGSVVDSEVEPEAARRSREQQLTALDQSVGEILDVLPQDATVWLVAGANAVPTADLQVVAVRGPQYPPGLLTSSSTKQPGLVLLTDLTPTLFVLLDLPTSAALVGAPVVSEPVPGTWHDRLDRLLDEARKVHVYGRVAQPFFAAWVLLQLPLYAWATWAFRRTGDLARRRRILRVTGWVAVVFGSVPVATFLANTVPWWRWSPPEVWLVGLTLGAAGVVGAVARRLGRQHGRLTELGVVSATTAVVLAVDIATGGHLQTASLMGYSPIIAGRLYGFGNVAFALFATAVLLSCTWLADVLVARGRRSRAAWAVAGLGVLAVALDGLPAFGSDFGGTIALVIGVGLLWMAVRETAVTWRTAALLGLTAVAVVVLVSVADWLRPPDRRSHLGRFVQQVLDGELWDVVSRKVASNLDILFTSLVPLAVLFLAFVLLRPVGRARPVLREAFVEAPLLRSGLVAWAVTMAVGFAVNDSGIAIPAVGIMLVVPLLISLSVRLVEQSHTSDPPPRG